MTPIAIYRAALEEIGRLTTVTDEGDQLFCRVCGRESDHCDDTCEGTWARAALDAAAKAPGLARDGNGIDIVTAEYQRLRSLGGWEDRDLIEQLLVTIDAYQRGGK